MSDSRYFNETLKKILPDNFSPLSGALKNISVPKSELEVALAVLLVELASCDQNFEPREYQVISEALQKLFASTPQEVSALVHRAQLVLSNLRGTWHFAEILREELSEAQRKEILGVMDNLVAADQVEDGFEIYLKNKFRTLLGFSTP